MISVCAALELLSQNLIDWKETSVSIEDSFGCFLARDLLANFNSPPFPRVCMDGIGLSFEAIEKGRKDYSLAGTQKAGEPQKELQNKMEALEVMTGAPIPQNCNVVIPYEEISIKEDRATVKISLDKIKRNQHIQPEGENFKEGDLLLPKGKRINSATLGLLASMGQTQVRVFIPPKIAIISTGDELVSIEEKPLLHQIRRSNPFSLGAELRGWGIESVSDFHFKDDPKELYSGLEKVLNENQVILITGGVSAGKYDYIPSILNDLGAKKVFHKVKQRPGKPLWFGRGKNGQAIFGLPGNPVSCLVGLRKYVVPYLQKSLGIENSQLGPFEMTLGSDVTFKKDFSLFQLGNVDSQRKEFFPQNHHGSGDILSFCKSDGFLELPGEKSEFKKGEKYNFYPWANNG